MEICETFECVVCVQCLFAHVSVCLCVVCVSSTYVNGLVMVFHLVCMCVSMCVSMCAHTHVVFVLVCAV